MTSSKPATPFSRVLASMVSSYVGAFIALNVPACSCCGYPISARKATRASPSSSSTDRRQPHDRPDRIRTPRAVDPVPAMRLEDNRFDLRDGERRVIGARGADPATLTVTTTSPRAGRKAAR